MYSIHHATVYTWYIHPVGSRQEQKKKGRYFIHTVSPEGRLAEGTIHKSYKDPAHQKKIHVLLNIDTDWTDQPASAAEVHSLVGERGAVSKEYLFLQMYRKKGRGRGDREDVKGKGREGGRG